MNRRTFGLIAVVGVVGWIGLLWLGVTMFGTTPRTAGFDLELLLQAGRDVAAGRSPYDPAMLAGTAPVAERLFYSYPPIVAQVLAVTASIPSGAMFVAWTVAAVGAFAAVAAAITKRVAPALQPSRVAAATVLLAPLLFPWAIGLLFGNLDVFFPTVYGLLLLGVLPAASTSASILGGVAASGAALAKLHPGSLGAWLLIRARGAGPARRGFVAAALAGGGAFLVSLALAPDLWSQYLTVVRAGSGADLVDPARNAGPAAIVAGLLRGSGPDADAITRSLQIPVALAALGLTAVAAWRVDDPVESLAWAATASLVILPVTWYHYPSALIPFGLVALLRAPPGATATTVRALLLAGAVVGAAAIAWLPLLWVAVGLVLAAVHRSRPARVATEAPATARAVRA